MLNFMGDEHGQRGLTARVQALAFGSDFGFREWDNSFEFVPYDSDTKNLSSEAVCKISKCIRKKAWAYARLDPRGYDAFGQSQPNSNSFLGAIAKACEIEGIDGVPSFPVYPDNHPRRGKPMQPGIEGGFWGGERASVSEGRFLGWHYWQRHGRSWESSRT